MLSPSRKVLQLPKLCTRINRPIINLLSFLNLDPKSPKRKCLILTNNNNFNDSPEENQFTAKSYHKVCEQNTEHILMNIEDKTYNPIPEEFLERGFGVISCKNNDPKNNESPDTSKKETKDNQKNNDNDKSDNDDSDGDNDNEGGIMIPIRDF